MQIDLWELIKVVAIPLAIIIVGFVWRRIDKNEGTGNLRFSELKLELDALRQQAASAALEAERRYINWKHMDDFKLDMFKRMDRVSLESKQAACQFGQWLGRTTALPSAPAACDQRRIDKPPIPVRCEPWATLPHRSAYVLEGTS